MIKQNLEAEMKEAMKARNQGRLSVLRMMKAEFLLKEKEAGKPLDDTSADQVLRGMLKKYGKSRDEYKSLGKQEEAERYEKDMNVIESFMLAPMMDETQIREELNNLVCEMNATGPKDFGRVMKAFMLQHSNADGKLVSSLLKETLERN